MLTCLATTSDIVNEFIRFLNDYTTDRRGDIGSLIRMEAIQGARIILSRETSLEQCTPWMNSIVGCLCRLAAEKLDKVRLQAWICLQEYWETTKEFPPLHR